jgi:uncharacterized DUF497 family protein
MAARWSFEWDDEKALRNQAKHHVEFSYATNVFLDPNRADFDVSRVEDRETRRKAIGLVEGRLLTVVYTSRAGSIRIISARRSNSREIRAYGALHA